MVLGNSITTHTGPIKTSMDLIFYSTCIDKQKLCKLLVNTEKDFGSHVTKVQLCWRKKVPEIADRLPPGIFVQAFF